MVQIFFMIIFQFFLPGSISIMVFGITTFISPFFVGSTSRKRITRISLVIYAVGTIILLFSSNPLALGIGLGVQALFISKCFIRLTRTFLDFELIRLIKCRNPTTILFIPAVSKFSLSWHVKNSKIGSL